jgi:hypothetical protein
MLQTGQRHTAEIDFHPGDGRLTGPFLPGLGPCLPQTLASGVGECRGRLGGWRTLANPSVFTTSSVPLPARGQWGRTHQWLLDCNEVSRKEQMLSGRESRDDKVSEQA